MLRLLLGRLERTPSYSLLPHSSLLLLLLLLLHRAAGSDDVAKGTQGAAIDGMRTKDTRTEGRRWAAERAQEEESNQSELE